MNILPANRKMDNDFSALKEDVDTIKKDGSEFAQHVAEVGKEGISDLSKAAHEQVAHVKEEGKTYLHKMEACIKEKPTQSMAIAFGVGLLTSILLGRR